MKSIAKSGVFAFCATCLAAAAFAADDTGGTLNVYNWNDYEAPDTVSNFEKQTGIKVTTDYFDTNEVLEAKLLAGKSGYDIVVPGSDFLSRQIKAGVFHKLDKSKIPNLAKLDPVRMKMLAELDPDNEHAVPYQQGTTGIGFNVDKVKEAFGEDFRIDSWDFVFKPENISKLKACGVAVMNNPTEIFATALNYLKLDPNSTNPKDYAAAAKLLLTIRPYIRYFHSSQYIADIATGDVCLVIGWSGDIMQGRDRAVEAKNGVVVDYVVPKEGALVWYDMMAIPADAQNVENAYKYINYILEPKVIADISNYTSYSNVVSESTQFLDPELVANPNVNIPAELMPKMFMIKPHDTKINKTINTLWTKIKAGK
ncbi:MAG: polyamine ABC transporter substrate-binding protein [Succinivibrionaceae bacterium]|nr:polyamine ABC transporter substrate-binding protein [Succinivibrionaceae bacterium]